MHRKILYWKLRDRELQLGERTIVMGVLNITPDSFSDGGLYSDPERAYARALELEEQGADIIDIGAESTRPGAEPVSADEEWRRLVPLLKKLRGALSVPVSLDTYKSETAERALQYDVHILNDPSGLPFDPALAKVAATGNMGLILNHMRGRPEQWAKMGPLPDAIGTVTRELDATASRARHAGVDRQRIVVDPGIGFGKRKEQNSELLAQLGHLSKLELPILVGPSRKSFLAQGTEKETQFATAAAITAAILNGAHIVRVHDVKEMLAVVRVADEIARSAAPDVEPQAERPAAKARPVSKMPVWEEEKPKPTRPPIKRQEMPAAEPSAPLQKSAGSAEEGAGSAENVPLQENAPPPSRPQERPERSFERREGSAPPRQFDRVPKLDRPTRSFDKRPWERREENPRRRPDTRPGFNRPDADRPENREERPAAGGPGGDRPTNKFGDKPFRKPGGDRPFGRPGDRPFGRPGDRPFSKSGDRPFNKSGDRPFGKPGDRPFGKPGDRPFRKPGDKPFGKPGERSFSKPPFGKSGDRPFRKPGDRPFGRPGGDRPGGDRPAGDRPPFRGGPPRGDRPGGNRGPSGPRKPFRKD